MSRSWLDEYTSGLEARDEREKAAESIINAYTKLADEYAALYKTKNSIAPADASSKRETAPAAPASARPSTPRLPPSLLGGITARSPSPASAAAGLSSTDAQDGAQNDASLRADLSSANRNLRAARAESLALRNELEALRGTLASKEADAVVAANGAAKLRAEKAALARKLRDRESELTEKSELVSAVQDENAGLEMQLNVAEQRTGTLERENGELVARWMRRVGREADAMNEGSGWR